MTQRRGTAARLAHVGRHGSAKMVDVGAKPATERRARAAGEIRMSPAAWRAIRANSIRKGDVLAVAKVAGIQAAKRTAELIPLCHPLALTSVDVSLRLVARPASVRVEAEVATTAPTGVEMEALTAVTVALLTVYDMAKSADRGMRIGSVRLLEKSGGRSGRYRARSA
ncbi:MAG: cyclic pyranopterin monophosphate synthase MoaC [Gemmatimonadaceae bacterium]|nr:cyclic pyranopterin monophosphate synthase MoaC [Gemmatimonadaceae bacterium]